MAEGEGVNQAVKRYPHLFIFWCLDSGMSSKKTEALEEFIFSFEQNWCAAAPGYPLGADTEHGSVGG